MVDLWGFKNFTELEVSTQDMPDSILKEQIGLLAEKTNYHLYGKARSIKIRSEDIFFKLATIFDIVVPSLDNYSVTILIMYSNPESDYPVAISVGNSLEEDIESFNPRYNCEDKEGFIESIKEILDSQEVLHMVKILFSKANMLSDH